MRDRNTELEQYERVGAVEGFCLTDRCAELAAFRPHGHQQIGVVLGCCDTAFRSKQKIKASSETIGKFFKKLTSKPSSWNSNPLESFHKSASNFKDAKKELAIIKNEESKTNDSIEIEDQN